MYKIAKNIVIWGYYGANYGDNIMLLQILDSLKEVSDLNIFIIPATTDVERVLKDYSDTNIIYREYTNKRSRIKWLMHLPKNALHIWGGGTIFTDEEGDGNAIPFLLQYLRGSKFGYVSCGVGKLTKIERIIKTKLVLSRASFCVMRDTISYNKAKKLSKTGNIVCSDDMVMAYAANVRKTNSKEKVSFDYGEYILISWRSLGNFISPKKEQKLIKELMQIINELCKSFINMQVKILPLDIQYDKQLSMNIKEQLEEDGIKVELILDNDVNRITEIVKHAKIYFCGRLHGCMIAEALGVPTYALAYSPKMFSFYKLIKQSNYIDILSDQFPTTEFIANKIFCDNRFDEWDKYQNAAENNLCIIKGVFNGSL